MKNNSGEVKICPHCGSELSDNALSCSECGSDEKTGWSDMTYMDGIDLEDDIDYETLKENEFGSNKKVSLSEKIKVVISILLILLFVVIMIIRAL